MRQSLVRLTRLCQLRQTMADAASLQTQRVLRDLEDTFASLRTLGEASYVTEAVTSSIDEALAWSAYRASCDVASRQQAVRAEQCETLQATHNAARLAEREAVLQREQMMRLSERLLQAVRRDEDRREQARMDEAYASSLFHRNLTKRL